MRHDRAGRGVLARPVPEGARATPRGRPERQRDHRRAGRGRPGAAKPPAASSLWEKRFRMPHCCLALGAVHLTRNRFGDKGNRPPVISLRCDLHAALAVCHRRQQILVNLERIGNQLPPQACGKNGCRLRNCPLPRQKQHTGQNGEKFFKVREPSEDVQALSTGPNQALLLGNEECVPRPPPAPQH